MRRHADLPIAVVCSIEERWFVGTTLHVAFVNGSLKFLAKYLAAVPKLPPNTSELAKLKYSSQLVTRVLRSILWNGTIPTQQIKSDLELR